MSDQVVYKIDKIVDLMHEEIEDEFSITRLSITDCL